MTRRASPPPDRKARGAAAIRPHLRLLICAALGVLAGTFWPAVSTLLSRALIGWNVATWTYLLWVLVVLLRADAGHMKRVALAQAESGPAVLAIVAGAVIASVVAVTFELLAAKAAGPGQVWSHGAFAATTVIGSWLLPLLFALSYAAEYFRPEPDGGLQFPARRRASSPTTPISSTSRSRSR